MQEEIRQVAALLRGRRFAVLSGAGISTESGIPDYRGPERAGKPATPIQHREFRDDPAARRRYWARSAVGWPWISTRTPNKGHRAIAQLEWSETDRSGGVSGVITQNVDGLHQAAGSANVIELHGALRNTVCLDCGTRESRESVQERIGVLNPGWRDRTGDIAPDGDVHLDPLVSRSFVVPACMRCGGVLKPDVVFFGDNVPQDRVGRAFDIVDSSHALLVVGSSLTVYSGYRFVDRARKRGLPVAIVNRGPTRADAAATVRIDAPLGEFLPLLAEHLTGEPASPGC
jgi:NAD-dependent SIR2 family protein deacetylase